MGNLKRVPAFILCLMFAAVFAIPSFAKSTGTIKPVKQALGYCVAKGAISHVSESACKKHHGIFFKNKQDAKGYLDVRTPGWCCLGGKTLAMKKGDCLKKKGHFFKNKKAASTWCDLHQEGLCCLDGKITKMLKGECLKKKGKFFLTQKAARDTCNPLGWCLLEGKITHARKSACEKKKGRFFPKKAAAERAARSVSAGAKEKGHKKRAGTAGIVAPGLAGARPYLTVERLYLRKVENYYLVYVDIKNRGRGKLTKEDYNKGALALRREGSKWHWPLFKVDKKGDLNRGKTVSYATGAIISAPTTVQIYFMHVPGGTKSARLMPPIGTFVKGAKKSPAAGAAIPARPMRAARKPGKSATTLGPGRMMGRKVKPKFKVPEAVTKDLQVHGLRINVPSGGEEFYNGETIHIHYRITDEDVTSGTITFNLSNGSDTFASSTVPVTRGREGETTIDVPRIIPSGVYKITADFSDTPSLGTSQSADFSIHSETVGINMEPTRSDNPFEYHPGGPLYISYYLDHRVAPGTISFYLYNIHTHEVVATQTIDYHPGDPVEPENERRSVVTFEIPPDLSSYGYYRIGARHPHAFGFSRSFVIRPRPGTETSSWDIHVLTPSEGASWALGSTQHIEWRISGDYPAERHFLIVVTKEGHHGPPRHWTFSGDGADWHPTTHTYSLGWLIGRNLPEGDGYSISVVDLNGPAEDTSGEFIIRGGDWHIQVSPFPASVPFGSTHTIVWVLHGDYRDSDIRPEDFRVDLYRGDFSVATLPGTPEWHPRFHSFSLPWEVLARGFMDGSEESDHEQPYKIVVSDVLGRTGNAESNEFTFVNPSANGLRFTNPSEPATFFVGSTYHIQWDATGDAAGTRVHLKLMRGEVPLMTIATVGASAGRYDWTIPGLCDGATPITGEGLSLRLITPRETEGSHYHAESVPIDVKMPRININGQAGGFVRSLYHPTDHISLSWTVEGNRLPDSPWVMVQLYHDGSFVANLANNIHTAQTGSVTCPVGSWGGLWVPTENAPPGTGYRIRVKFVGCPQLYGETRTFTLLEER